MHVVNLHITGRETLRIPQSHLMRYWHIGRSRKARATVAITAVQDAKSI